MWTQSTHYGGVGRGVGAPVGVVTVLEGPLSLSTVVESLNADAKVGRHRPIVYLFVCFFFQIAHWKTDSETLSDALHLCVTANVSFSGFRPRFVLTFRRGSFPKLWNEPFPLPNELVDLFSDEIESFVSRCCTTRIGDDCVDGLTDLIN